MTTVRYDGIGGYWNDDGTPTRESINRECISSLIDELPSPPPSSSIIVGGNETSIWLVVGVLVIIVLALATIGLAI